MMSKQKQNVQRHINRIREWPGLGSISLTKTMDIYCSKRRIHFCQNVTSTFCIYAPVTRTSRLIASFQRSGITGLHRAAPPYTKGWHLTCGYLPKLTLLPPFKRHFLIISDIIMIMVSYDDQCHLSCWIQHLFIMILIDEDIIIIIVLLLFIPDIVSKQVVFWRHIHNNIWYIIIICNIS